MFFIGSYTSAVYVDSRCVWGGGGGERGARERRNERLIVLNFSLKQRSDADLDQLRERIRKVEQEIDKLKVENKELHENEQKANDAYKEEMNRAHLLQRELEDAKIELDELRSEWKIQILRIVYIPFNFFATIMCLAFDHSRSYLKFVWKLVTARRKQNW